MSKFIINIKKQEPLPNKINGLGDLVEKFAEPIKHKIIKSTIVPERIKKVLNNCGCKKRKDKLNKLFPFK